MKSRLVVCTIMALSLTTGGFSFAQGSGLDADRNAVPRDAPAQQRNLRNDRRDPQVSPPNRDRRDPQVRPPNRDQRHGYADNVWRGDERGAGPNRQFHRGDRLSPQYRHRNYVVNDWRGHGLRAPPRGYHWVQTGGDYVLVAIATGIILELMLNN